MHPPTTSRRKSRARSFPAACSSRSRATRAATSRRRRREIPPHCYANFSRIPSSSPRRRRARNTSGTQRKGRRDEGVGDIGRRTPNVERPDPVKPLIPFRIQPMLATLVDQPFHLPGGVYEEKYDGYRILAYKEGEKVTLVSRNGKDRTESFADVAKA